MTTPIYDETILSCLHKDARGFRPSKDFFTWWDSLTVQEKNDEWSLLCAEVEESIEADRLAQIRNIAALEERLQDGAKKVGTTVQAYTRWDFQAHDIPLDGQGVGFYLYLCGVSALSYEETFKQKFLQGG